MKLSKIVDGAINAALRNLGQLFYFAENFFKEKQAEIKGTFVKV